MKTDKQSASRFCLAAYGPDDDPIRSDQGNPQVVRVELHEDGVVLAVDDLVTKDTAFAIKLSPDTAKVVSLALNHVAFKLSPAPVALGAGGDLIEED